ncbi:tRNA (adenosine(37)-N6)-threonylcarbamoyltransferase complex ATPase subunit type 1 TsaE [Candidatus Daviesbacteria bacterium RIFCSPLOWO2_02_FULL_38_15]|uniref:tRNA threonylcarbamoyladenosine biosynthesis protein TsaE n=1 Tax=Candidatus Daviesbacteria bacterium RIFCSPLOWO2_02_FULL_38_15 TaxID=1797794 RepID=A0A1F5N475_9BACT|nr:MAG: tRNA (adenosine(37)-N6)-threonylcarbamoyltransferase complex ATPase subunit type 1 TsaE [Candidatus Daviesbacteria bacterium RIFCSPLOWO2_02_FULL_38_15]
MQKYISHSADETKKLAQRLAQNTQARIFALTGDLGAGKTIFVQGFAQGLDIKEKIISPTFVLIRQHHIPNTDKTLYHIDLYRLEKEEDFKQLGLKDLLNDSNHLILIEWAEKIKGLLPKMTTWIYLETANQNSRQITIV